MKLNKEIDAIIDSTAEGIRNCTIENSTIELASQRVWARVASESGVDEMPVQPAVHSIEGCDGYKSLIPAYLRGELSTARRLLLEDHTGECVPCRRALKQARSGETVSTRRTAQTYAYPLRNGATQSMFGHASLGGLMTAAHWRVAAALIVTASLIGFYVWQPFGGKGFGGVVQAADGALYRVADEESRALGGGDRLNANESIRTGREAHAVVRLEDGTTLEMRERSQFSLTERRQGATVNVERGNFIVQMPAEKSKTLYVATDDGLVSASGATFSVASGTKGTRVTVINGEATVDSAGTTKVLRAGEQFTSRANLEAVAPAADVRWSRDAARYDQLISAAQNARADIDARAARPGVRHSTRLLDLAPADTTLYVALPNWSRTLTEARAILQTRMNENPALRDWWQQRDSAGNGRSIEFDSVLEQVGAWGEQLKDEIVIAAGQKTNLANGAPGRVLLLSEVKDPARFRNFVSEQLARISTNDASQGNKTSPPRVRIIDDLSAAVANPASGAAPEIFVWIHDDLVAVSPQLAPLQELAARMNVLPTDSTASFKGSSLHTRLTDLYREGTSLIIAVDLERGMAEAAKHVSASSAHAKEKARERAAFQQTGFSDARHFIIESKDARDLTMNRAVLSFNGERRGIAAWLAAPAPMGSLDFISSEAAMAAAFVVKEPTAVVNDFFELLKTTDPALWQSVSEAQAANGIDIRRDLAAPLGGEFAFAVDGPLLPVPSWKLIFEVYDPARLNATFERLVEKLNQVAAREGKRGFVREQEEAGGRMFYTIKSLDLGLSAHYTYEDNYLVMTPSRALLDRALRFRDAQQTLARAQRFTASLPADGDANFSALFYQNLGGVLDPLKRTMRGFGVSPDGNKDADRESALEALDTFSPPTLAYVRADANSIVIAAPTKGGPFGVTPSTFLNLPGGSGLGNIISHGVGEGSETR